MATKLQTGPRPARYTGAHCDDCGGPARRGRDLCGRCETRLIQRVTSRGDAPPRAIATATRLG